MATLDPIRFDLHLQAVTRHSVNRPAAGAPSNTLCLLLRSGAPGARRVSARPPRPHP